MLRKFVLLLLLIGCKCSTRRVTRQNENAYAVNPPEESYVIQREGPNRQNAYGKPSNTQNAYVTSTFGGSNQGAKPQNVYPVKPPQGDYNRPSQNAYGKPTQSDYTSGSQNGPSQNAYGKPTQSDYNVASQNGPSQNAYGKPTQSDFNRPNQNAYPVQYESTENAYGKPTENAYGKPTQNDFNRPNQNAYPVQQTPFQQNVPQNAYPVQQAPFQQNIPQNPRPETTQRPFQPNLLSGPTTTNIPEEIPKVIIDKDQSIYTKDASGLALLPKNDEGCEVSKTIANGKSTCKGQLIFQENFDELNENKWRHDVRIPGKPDYEFVVYVQSKNNSIVENGNLIIRPTLLSDYDPDHDVVTDGALQLNGCRLGADSGYCSKQTSNYNILPPVISSRLRTKHSFSFKYGKIKIRAKMPRGDWLYPQLWLEPKDNTYGRGYPSGRIVLGLSRGNPVFVSQSKQTMGIQQLNVGCLFRTNDNTGSNHGKYIEKINENGWDKSFHNFSVVWTPESMEFFVDDENLGTCPGPNLEGRKVSPWKRGTKMAPFDEEFYISIGLAAGGISEFPDGSTNGREGERKPWKNSGAKALLNFYDDESNWWSSWKDNSELKVDSIEVHAL